MKSDFLIMNARGLFIAIDLELIKSTISRNSFLLKICQNLNINLSYIENLSLIYCHCNFECSHDVNDRKSQSTNDHVKVKWNQEIEDILKYEYVVENYEKTCNYCTNFVWIPQ